MDFFFRWEDEKELRCLTLSLAHVIWEELDIRHCLFSRWWGAPNHCEERNLWVVFKFLLLKYYIMRENSRHHFFINYLLVTFNRRHCSSKMSRPTFISKWTIEPLGVRKSRSQDVMLAFLLPHFFYHWMCFSFMPTWYFTEPNKHFSAF